MNTKICMMWGLAWLCLPTLAMAQEDWRFSGAVNTMTGEYQQAQVMRQQHGQGVRISGEQRNAWGFTAGVQATHIDMQPWVPKATQEQNNWLLSSHRYVPSASQTGRWKLQLDVHRVFNDAVQGNSDGVSAVMPQVGWVSLERPLSFDLSYAHSRYQNTPAIHQISPSVGLGFNNGQNWFQIRGYVIQGLEPNLSMGMSSSHATDLRLTQLLQSSSPWVPKSITLGVERGKKIYFVDAVTQTVHNLPMRNDGGENISARWYLGAKTHLTLQLQQTCYFSNALTAHEFTLKTMSAQLGRDW